VGLNHESQTIHPLENLTGTRSKRVFEEHKAIWLGWPYGSYHTAWPRNEGALRAKQRSTGFKATELRTTIRPF
jgi:hypothetical protein